MGARKKLKTNKDWLEKFTDKLFKKENFLFLSEEKAENYPNLSSEHIYHLEKEIARLIYNAFQSCWSNEDAWLHTIQLLHPVIRGIEVQNKETGGSSSYIELLSRLNMGNLKSIEWYLSEAIGPRHYKLDMVNNVEDYQEVVKEIVKDTSLNYLRNFYNFLVTKPSLTETEQKMVNTIQSTFTSSENVPSSPKQIAYPNMSPA